MQFWFSLYNASPLLFLLNKHRLTKHTNADLFIIKKNTYRLVKEYGVKLIYFRHLLLQLNPTKPTPIGRLDVRVKCLACAKQVKLCIIM